MNEPKTYASETGHWYDSRTGEPRYTIIGANGKERPTTLRDAKKHGYYISVTGILKCADKPGLRRYFDRQMYEAAFTTPREPADTDDTHFEKCLLWAREHATAAADMGTRIHAAIEQHLLGEAVEPVFMPIVQQTMDALRGAGVEIGNHCAEKSFAHPLGFGGKVDFHNPSTVLDFKTKQTIEKCNAYDEHGMQLEAYRLGLGLSPDVRRLNVFIATDGTGIKVHEWEKDEQERHLKMFLLLLDYWKVLNRFNP